MARGPRIPSRNLDPRWLRRQQLGCSDVWPRPL